MDTRERFVRTLTGKPVDRVPFMKVFGGTNAVKPHWEEQRPGISTCIDEILQFDGRYRGWACAPVNMDPSSLRPVEILEQDDTRVVRRRGDGAVEVLLKGGDFHRQVLEWPIKDRASWERVRDEHVQADDPSRFPSDWAEWVEDSRERDYPLQLTHRGVYGFARNMLGDVNLAYAFYDDPELVHEIMDTYTEMAIVVWERMVAELDFDLIECWEDMASKNGSFVSPKTFREFMTPNYQRIAEFARAHGIEVILVDSDGLIEELTGLMLESGATALYPYEVRSGNDVARVLDTYAQVGVVGGLEKNVMAEGKAAMDRELEKARRLIRKGRFIPGPDHFVLSNVDWPDYQYFMGRLREVVLTTPVGVE